jgi:hypothetical protein
VSDNKASVNQQSTPAAISCFYFNQADRFESPAGLLPFGPNASIEGAWETQRTVKPVLSSLAIFTTLNGVHSTAQTYKRVKVRATLVTLFEVQRELL